MSGSYRVASNIGAGGISSLYLERNGFSIQVPMQNTTLTEDYVVTSDPAVCGGRPVVKGTRVPVQYIIELSERGYGAHKIHEQYPSVSEELIPKIVEQIQKNRLIKISW